MKVFRKMFAFAVTVAAIAMATSAFAATAEYDSANVKVKVADVSALTETAQMTVAVVETGFDGTDDGDIYYIDQDQADAIKANLQAGLAVKEALTVPTNYEVRVAGTSMDMQTINFQAVQAPEYIVVGENLTSATAVGFKGSFSYNGNAKTVVLTLKDANNSNATGTVEWDLLDGINTNATITFGLEIQSAEPRDLSGITITDIADAQ